MLLLLSEPTSHASSQGDGHVPPPQQPFSTALLGPRGRSTREPRLAPVLAMGRALVEGYS